MTHLTQPGMQVPFKADPLTTKEVTMTTRSATNTNPDTPATRFLSAGGFHYDMSCEPIAALANHFNLRITSQWDGARRPDDHQVVLNLTLTQNELASMTGMLQRHLETGVTTIGSSPAKA